jgi:hypothetical protein
MRASVIRKLFLAGAAVLVVCPHANAFGSRPVPRQPCMVFSSEFFGYYRTCWYPWPGGQPPCPGPLRGGQCQPAVAPAEGPLPATTQWKSPGDERLPEPMGTPPGR